MAGHQQNPRKFSEKIAIHDRKTQEGMMEFDRIMREVKEITRGNPNEDQNRGNNGVAPTQTGMQLPYRTFPSGSLPNVSHMPPFPVSY